MDVNISTQLSQYIAKEILKQPKRQIEGNTRLISGGLVDSFHLVDLAVFIEEQFGVHIDDSELNKDTFDTLDQLVMLVEQRRG